uniref:phosphoribosylanthranilate isomerase n=1 Tax=Synechococcus sp. CS-1329 TaxID=2847975 RepID=UPI00223ABB6C|nr:phosphoribosylanthranilate isomerase [Synechococcus sp. CS-1329]
MLLSPLLKICGLRQPAQARAVAQMGVDALGVIAVPSSPRWLAPEQRLELFQAMSAGGRRCRGVLVLADPGDELGAQLEPSQGHQVLQLHGRESPGRCRELAERTGCAIWKALRIRSPDDLERAADYGDVVEALLLDAWVPDQLGGSGRQIPGAWLQGFRPRLPWWLAGGVGPSNAAELVAAFHPDGLDVSSSVERAPGEKDLDLVRALVTVVRGAAAGAN